MMRKLSILARLLVAVLTVLAACTTAGSGPTTWLDQPLDGVKLPLARLVIMAHASDDNGLRRFEFFIDQQSLVSVTAGGGRFGEASVEWAPSAPGTYTVHVRAVDNQGNAGPDAISVVTIGGIVSQPPFATRSPSPAPAIQLQLTASPTPSPNAAAATLTPMTSTVSPTPTTPAVAELVARQNANCRLGPGTAYETTGFLLQGQRALVVGRNTQSDWFFISLPSKAEKCWVSKSTVEFQGNINLLAVIAAPPPPQLPPQIITITVSPPPPQIITVLPPPVLDITAPIVSFPSALPLQILVAGSGCPSYSRTTVVSATVTDESGVKNVAARWSIGGQAGEVSMSPSGGGVYQAVIGPLNTVGQLSITVFAVDLAGNSAESGPAIVQVQNCIE